MFGSLTGKSIARVISSAVLDNKRVKNVSICRSEYSISEIDSYCLIFSSCFFLIPGYCALLYGLYFYLATSVVTTIVSVNYWRNAVPGWRRWCDLFVAKLSFLIYFCTGLIYIKNHQILFIAWPICGGIIMFYFLSNRMWKRGCHTWVFYHMMFHLFVAVEQFIVLFGSFY
jgi:hypothetical protein